jgi:hypothetical protein
MRTGTHYTTNNTITVVLLAIASLVAAAFFVTALSSYCALYDHSHFFEERVCHAIAFVFAAAATLFASLA